MKHFYDIPSADEQWRDYRIAQGLDDSNSEEDWERARDEFEETPNFYESSDGCQDYNHFIHDDAENHWGMRAFDPDDIMARRASVFVDEPRNYQSEPLPDEYLNESLIKSIVRRCLREEIEIDKENEGKFTATKKKLHKSTEQLTHSKNPLTRKRAIFAQNAKKWSHNKD